MYNVLVPILIFIAFLIIPVSLLLVIAYQDAKKRDLLQLKLLQDLPEATTGKAIVRFNIGRPQGRFLKEKNFQGSGILYTMNKLIYFKDSFHTEDKVFHPNTVVIKWHDESEEQNIKNSFSLSDGQETIYLYVDQAQFVFNSSPSLTSTYDLYLQLKDFQSANS